MTSTLEILGDTDTMFGKKCCILIVPSFYFQKVNKKKADINYTNVQAIGIPSFSVVLKLNCIQPSHHLLRMYVAASIRNVFPADFKRAFFTIGLFL